MPSGRPSLALSTPLAKLKCSQPNCVAVVKTPPSATSCSTPLPSAGLLSSESFAARLSSLTGTSDGPAPSPVSAKLKHDEALIKTPLSPPTAYLDFLKSMSLASPQCISPREAPQHRVSTSSTSSSLASRKTDSTGATSVESEGDKDKKRNGEIPLSSPPSTASSSANDDSRSKRRHSHKRPPSPISTTTPIPATLCGRELPMSAPLAESSTVSPLIPPPMSVKTPDTSTRSPVRPPLSARSFTPATNPFDWEAASKARQGPAPAPGNPALSPTTIKTERCVQETVSKQGRRHIKEVVTRTVVYTPKADPAPTPTGKKRKAENPL